MEVLAMSNFGWWQVRYDILVRNQVSVTDELRNYMRNQTQCLYVAFKQTTMYGERNKAFPYFDQC